MSPIEKLIRVSRVTSSSSRGIHITSTDLKEFRVGSQKLRSTDIGKHVILDGEGTVEVQSSSEQQLMHPDAFTPDKLFDNVPFKQLHIVNIKSTPNNTIMSTTDAAGKVILLHSAGIEGFKNAKKGTNIAAQQAAITMGTRTLENDIKTVRVRVQGIGAGRMAAIKGLELAGLKIVSITDDTRVSDRPPRPRKQRRV